MGPRDIDSLEVFAKDVSVVGDFKGSCFFVPLRRKSVAQPPARLDSIDFGSEPLRSSKTVGMPGGGSGRDAVLSCLSSAIVGDCMGGGIECLLIMGERGGVADCGLCCE